jgi:hypothetical protein
MPEENDITQNQPDNRENESGPIDWSSLSVDDLPDNIIANIPSHRLKSNPAYSQALQEAIERRQKIQELKSSAGSENLPGDKGGDDSSDNSSNAGFESPELAAIQEQIAALTNVVSGFVKETRSDMIESAMQKYKLTDEMRGFITGNTREEIQQQAELLAKFRGKNFEDNSSSGDGPTPKATDALQKRLKERLTGGGQRTSAFDSDVQTRTGGGVLSN